MDLRFGGQSNQVQEDGEIAEASGLVSSASAQSVRRKKVQWEVSQPVLPMGS